MKIFKLKSLSVLFLLLLSTSLTSCSIFPDTQGGSGEELDKSLNSTFNPTPLNPPPLT